MAVGITHLATYELQEAQVLDVQSTTITLLGNGVMDRDLPEGEKKKMW